MEPRLKETFKKKIQPTLKEKFGYKNLYMGPQIYKVVLNKDAVLAPATAAVVSERNRRRVTDMVDSFGRPILLI